MLSLSALCMWVTTDKERVVARYTSYIKMLALIYNLVASTLRTLLFVGIKFSEISKLQ
jgi:hypothetical protein